MRICSQHHLVSDNASYCGDCGEHLDPQYPPGWYPDPDQSGRVQFWDGTQWAPPPQAQPLSRALIPQATADALLSRRKSWDGVVVQGRNAHPSAPDYNHYFRVTDSWRNPETGEYGWTADYLGPEPPQGEPIYVYDGTTWDMSAVPRTVFPWFTTALCLIAFVAIWPIDHALYGNYQAAIMFGWLFLFQPFVTWFQKVEPVRYTKVVAVYLANSAARSAHRTRSDSRAAEVNQSVRETARSHW